jgi:hypoxanthine-DNA glycosylase
VNFLCDIFTDVVEVHPFVDFVPQNAKYLILGSFVARQGLKDSKECEDEYDWYYGRRINQFWPIIRAIYQEELSDTPSKKKLFEYLGIAVTDIIYSCKRTARTNSDMHLADIAYNTKGIEKILGRHKILKIFFTSRFVEQEFKRHFKEIVGKHPEIELITLPSPSRRNARMSFSKKVEVYKKLLPLLG